MPLPSTVTAVACINRNLMTNAPTSNRSGVKTQLFIRCLWRNEPFVETYNPFKTRRHPYLLTNVTLHNLGILGTGFVLFWGVRLKAFVFTAPRPEGPGR